MGPFNNSFVGRQHCQAIAWSGTSVPDRAIGLCRDLAGGVFSHVVAARLDPDDVVHDAVHDLVGVTHGSEALVWP